MFKIVLHTGNSAFGREDSDCAVYDLRCEIARILKSVSDSVEIGETSGSCRDYNGNRVGSWVLEDERI